MSIGASLSVEQTLEKASSERDAGRLDEAERLYRSVLKENPQDAAAQKELHKLLKGRRKPAKGSRRRNKPARKSRLAKAGSLQAKVALSPKPVAQAPQEDLHALVGLYKSGKLREAETQARRLIKKYPRTMPLFDVLVGTLVGQGKPEEAVAVCRQCLKIKPDYAVAHNNLGAVLSSLGKSEEAIESCQQALTINPDYAEAHINLGVALNNLGRYQEAVASYHRALNIKPDSAKAHSNLGSVLTSLNKPKEAMACYQKALKFKPDYTTALMNLGELYEKSNQLEKAGECIQEALRLAPDDPAVCRAWAVLLKRRGKIKEAIQTLNPFVTAACSEKVLSEIHTELGSLHDREKNTQTAFGHFCTANKLQARSPAAAPFRKEVFLSRVDQMERTLTSDWVRSWVLSEENECREAPAFIVGFPRSGTTLLDQILDSHPGIQVMEERPILREIEQQVTEKFGIYPSALAALGATSMDILREGYFQGVDKCITREKGTVLVDKLPLNIQHIPLMLRLFPNARIIIALRHPCDVVLSNFMQHYRINNAMANFFTLADAAHCYARVMGLWQKCVALLPMTYHTVKYESLVTDFESEVRSLLEYIGLDWDDAVCDYAVHAKQKEIINTPSYQSVTEPINTHAKYRWKRYREQLEPVLDELSPFIEGFGYSEAEAGEGT